MGSFSGSKLDCCCRHEPFGGRYSQYSNTLSLFALSLFVLSPSISVFYIVSGVYIYSTKYIYLYLSLNTHSDVPHTVLQSLAGSMNHIGRVPVEFSGFFCLSIVDRDKAVASCMNPKTVHEDQFKSLKEVSDSFFTHSLGHGK